MCLFVVTDVAEKHHGRGAGGEAERVANAVAWAAAQARSDGLQQQLARRQAEIRAHRRRLPW